MDLGFNLAQSNRDLKHPTSRQNFADVVGQNHALILIYSVLMLVCFFPEVALLVFGRVANTTLTIIMHCI